MLQQVVVVNTTPQKGPPNSGKTLPNPQKRVLDQGAEAFFASEAMLRGLGLGLRVSGLGFRASGLGFRGFEGWGWEDWIEVQGLRFNPLPNSLRPNRNANPKPISSVEWNSWVGSRFRHYLDLKVTHLLVSLLRVLIGIRTHRALPLE